MKKIDNVLSFENEVTNPMTKEQIIHTYCPSHFALKDICNRRFMSNCNYMNCEVCWNEDIEEDGE